MLEHKGDGVAGEPGAVLDAIDVGADQTGQRVLTERMCGDPCALTCATSIVALRTSSDHNGARSPVWRSIPVADELDPAVTEPSFLGHHRRKLRFRLLELNRKADLIALQPG